MKKFRLAVFLLILLIVAFLLLVFDEASETTGSTNIKKDATVSVVKDDSKKLEVKADEETSVKKQKYTFTQEEETMLLKLAKAEAGNQDSKGQALVMRVVLNRVESTEFTNNIHDVIFAKNQFSPIANGAYDKAEHDDITYDALQMVMYGWDETNGATYFRSENTYDTWHYLNLSYLFAYEDHWFFK